MQLSRIDLRFAFRALARDRVFLVSVVLTLALGIGAIAGVFAVLETALLRPLPYHQPDDLVRLFVVDLLTNRDRNPSLEEMFGLQGNTLSFQAMAAFGGKNLALIGADRTQSIRAMAVTPEFFALLGVRALRGRTLEEQDFLDDSNSAVISYGLWQKSFGGQDSVIGASVPVRVLGSRRRGEGNLLESLIIVGVLPPAFALDHGPDPHSRFFNNQFTGKRRKAELWLPMKVRPESFPNRRLAVIARLSDHLTLEQAEADSNLAFQHLQQQNNNAQARGEIGLIRLRDSLVGRDGRRLFQTFLLAAGCVLLACCLNAANLFIAHIAKNHDQYAILVALGASRPRLSRILVSQGLTVSLLAGLLGILLSAVFLLSLKSFAVPAIPRLEEVGLHAEVWIFVAAVAAGLGLLCGLVLLRFLPEQRLNEALRKGGAATAGHRGWLPKGAVVLELALTLGLLLGAGVLVRSFIKLLSVDAGFQTENVLVFKVPFPFEFLPEEDALIQFQLRTEEILGQVSSLPGVQWAATGSVPLRGFLGGGVYPEGSQTMIPVLVNPVSQDFFRVLGISLLQGRVFGVEDSGKSMSKVAVINQSLARRLWEDENPIGNRIRFGLNQEDWLTVVGVVEDVRRQGLHIQPSHEVYLPFLQSGSFADGQFMVKAQSDVAGLVTLLAQAIRELDKGLPLAEVKLLSEVVSDSTSSRRLVLWLIASFGAASLLVASIGLYGVVASYASHRRAEFGVRMALGATKRDILKLCIGNGLSLLVAGGMLGLGGAYFLSHRMSHLLYETSPTDPLAYAAVALLLLAVGSLACFFPAYKAARLDPNAVLRVE